MIQIYFIGGMIVDFGLYLDIRPVPFRPVSVDTLRRETERSDGKEGRQIVKIVGKRNRKKEIFGR